jgi:hypothetical protein
LCSGGLYINVGAACRQLYRWRVAVAKTNTAPLACAPQPRAEGVGSLLRLATHIWWKFLQSQKAPDPLRAARQQRKKKGRDRLEASIATSFRINKLPA